MSSCQSLSNAIPLRKGLQEEKLSVLNPLCLFAAVLFFTFIAEFLTVLSRVIFGSKKDRFLIKPPKLRVHHGYIGLLTLILGYSFYPLEALLLTGWVLFLSDAIHHFVVLPLWVGKTEFP